MPRMVPGMDGYTLSRIAARRDPKNLFSLGRRKANLLEAIGNEDLRQIAIEVITSRENDGRADDRGKLSPAAAAVLRTKF